MSAIDHLVARCRSGLDRVAPGDLEGEVDAGALVIDIRSSEQRHRDGKLPEAVIVDRNMLEWRLDPTSPYRIPEITSANQRVIVVCHEGYSSSLAAHTLRALGLHRATDLAGGYEAWLRWSRRDGAMSSPHGSSRSAEPRRRSEPICALR